MTRCVYGRNQKCQEETDISCHQFYFIMVTCSRGPLTYFSVILVCAPSLTELFKNLACWKASRDAHMNNGHLVLYLQLFIIEVFIQGKSLLTQLYYGNPWSLVICYTYLSEKYSNNRTMGHNSVPHLCVPWGGHPIGCSRNWAHSTVS